MALETKDPIDWSHPPSSYAVPPERLVHSINRWSSATAGIRSFNLATFSMRDNNLANTATQSIYIYNKQIFERIIAKDMEIINFSFFFIIYIMQPIILIYQWLRVLRR